MAHERSTEFTHKENPNQKVYDWNYYNALSPFITGNVLDIGAGAGMFAKEYAKKEDVLKVVCLDKYTEELPEVSKIQKVNWMCPMPLDLEDKFDTIISTEFIEHIEREQLEPLLDQIKEVMSENSLFIGSTPNKVSPTTNPYHLYEYTLSELEAILKTYFTDVKIWDCGQYCTTWVCKK